MLDGRSLQAGRVELADRIEIDLLAGLREGLSVVDLADELHDEPDGAEVPQGDTDDPVPTSWDQAIQLAEMVFLEIRERALWLKDRYPFDISDELISVNPQSECAMLYRFLCYLRARQLLRGDAEQTGEPLDVGLLFEELAVIVVKSYCGPMAVRFGLAGTGRGDGLPKQLPDAVRALSGLMNELAADNIKGQGDYRADAIAWRPFFDGHPGQLVVLCQATVSEADWFKKQIPKKWTDGLIVQFVAKVVAAVAFAESLSCYSTTRLAGTLGSIPFDRLRIASLVRDDEVPEEMATRIGEWSAWMSQRLA